MATYGKSDDSLPRRMAEHNKEKSDCEPTVRVDKEMRVNDVKLLERHVHYLAIARTHIPRPRPVFASSSASLKLFCHS